ncbi:LysR family transcriptional regulator [Streptococcus dentiloxodontae]
MNQEQLRHFIEVSQFGSFQQVADKHLMSQRAISKQMKDLEAELDVPLFIRGTNSINLTAAGRYFQKQAQLILNNMSMAQYQVKQFHGDGNCKLTVGYFSTYDAILLRDCIKALSKKKFDIVVEEKSIEHLLSDLMLDSIDCAIITDIPNSLIAFEDLGLKDYVIFEGEELIGIAEELVEPNQETFPLAWLQKYPILYTSHEESTFLQEMFMAHLKDYSEFMTLSRIATHEQRQLLVSTGQAIGFYPPKELVTLSQVKNEGIAYLPLETRSQYETFRLVTKADFSSPLFEEMLNYFKTIDLSY